MERAGRGEANDDTAQPLPPTGHSEPDLTPAPLLEVPPEDLLPLEEVDTQTIPGYLTLEMDVRGLQAFAVDLDEDQESAVEPVALDISELLELDVRELQAFTVDLDEDQESAVEPVALDISELLEPEELSLPDYLTLEIDVSALENEPPGQPSSDLEQRGPS
jgi:hypothetical protein